MAYLHCSHHRHGFTLVELSIVLIIVSLLASGGLAISASMVDRAAYTDTQKQLKMIEDALHDFYTVNGRLPCVARVNSPMNDANFGVEIETNGCDAATPDVAGDGIWRAVAANGPVRVGMVPVRTLGLQDIAARDKYGNRILYAVTEDLTRTSSFGSASGALVVEDVNDTEILDDAAYVLVSNGKDRKGAYLYQTGALDFGCASGFGEADRLNCDTHDEFFRDAPFNPGEVANTYFDDLIRWAPKFHFTANTTISSSLWAVDSTNPDSIISVGSDGNTVTGNVGIGVTNPQTKLHVSDAIRTDSRRIYLGADQYLESSGVSNFYFKSNSATSILGIRDSSETLLGGVYTDTNYIGLLSTNGSSQWNARFSRINNGDNIVAGRGNAGLLQLNAGTDTRDGGSITLIGRNNGGAGPGAIYYRAASDTNNGTDPAHVFNKYRSDDTYQTLVYIYTNGSMRIQGPTSCNIGTGSGNTSCTSDERLKKDIIPVDNALDKLLKVNGVYFKWNEKSPSADKETQRMGVIAQNVQSVFPEAVEKDNDETGYLSVNMSALIAPLIESVRELKNRNDALQAQITELKATQNGANTATSQNSTFFDMRMLVTILLAALVCGITTRFLNKK
jgi:prepilin-type N-terminal cleavage/methylation domain-containing protein